MAMVAVRCAGKALVVAFGVVAIYRAAALALLGAGVAPEAVVLAAAVGMALFGYHVSRRQWSSRRPGWWALLGAACGFYALPVLLFQAERAGAAATPALGPRRDPAGASVRTGLTARRARVA
jgi:hypothetical protein